MYKLDLEKPEEPEIKLPTSAGSQKKRGNSRKTSTSASITTLKPLTVSITKKQDKIKKEMGLSDHRTCLLRNLCLVAVVPYSLQPHGLQPTRLFCPWGFSRQEYQSGLPCLTPGDLANPGIEPRSPALQANPHAGQEATVRTGQEITDWFQIGKGVHQGYILSPSLFNLHAEYIMPNARLNDSQAGIKIARRNINSLTYVNNATLMAESEKELQSLLMKV